MLYKNIQNVLFCNLFFACVQASGFTEKTQDMTTSRANTLMDDADDLQKQLENEARDKLKYGKAKTILVLHFPGRFPAVTEMYRRSRRADLLATRVEDMCPECRFAALDKEQKPWDYKGQGNWKVDYPDCAGYSQSPVSLPHGGLVLVNKGRPLIFENHDVVPKSLHFSSDGKSVKLTGSWDESTRPFISGGAANSRRYLFDSILLHWPSEHTISGLQFPLETQATYVSAEYNSIKEAVNATNDKMAVLGVVSLFKFSNCTQEGIHALLKASLDPTLSHKPVNPRPLSFFHPPFKEYVCYFGSLTTPPCTESVIWMVRARSLPVTREDIETLQNMLVDGEPQHCMFRQTQRLNDRKVYFFP